MYNTRIIFLKLYLVQLRYSKFTFMILKQFDTNFRAYSVMNLNLKSKKNNNDYLIFIRLLTPISVQHFSVNYYTSMPWINRRVIYYINLNILSSYV